MIPEQLRVQKNLKTVYRLAENPTGRERESLGFNRVSPGNGGYVSESMGCHPREIGAVYTGEKRPPRKGEWFLSGSPIEAYRAPNDLSMVYSIARLVRVREVCTIEIVSEVTA